MLSSRHFPAKAKKSRKQKGRSKSKKKKLEVEKAFHLPSIPLALSTRLQHLGFVHQLSRQAANHPDEIDEPRRYCWQNTRPVQPTSITSHTSPFLCRQHKQKRQKQEVANAQKTAKVGYVSQHPEAGTQDLSKHQQAASQIKHMGPGSKRSLEKAKVKVDPLLECWGFIPIQN